MRLRRRGHWIFDLDGTLTVGVHDFDSIRRELDLPDGCEILEALAALSPEESRPRYRRLDAIEMDLARLATPAGGAAALLEGLRRRGARLGIVTRNSFASAVETLRTAGLARFFEARFLVGRDEARPKPDPHGIQTLLSRWRASPVQAVMVGDYKFDLQAGRAAGTATIYVDASGEFPHREHADLCVDRLDVLLRSLPSA